MIEQRFGDPIELSGVGWYRNRVGYDDGRAFVAWGGRGGADGTTMVHVDQTAFDGLGLDEGMALLRDVTAVGVTCSRLDEWMNDAERRITPARVREAVLGGQVVTHARPGVHMHDDDGGRETYYLGAPSSDRRQRTYDREDGPCRNELQSRRAAAAHAQALLLAASDPVSAIVSNIVAFADYRQSRRRGWKNARAARLPWWQEVVGDAAKATAAPSRPAPSLEEQEAYFREFWGHRLAELYHAFGPRWLDQVIRDGSHHLRLVRQEVAS